MRATISSHMNIPQARGSSSENGGANTVPGATQVQIMTGENAGDQPIIQQHQAQIGQQNNPMGIHLQQSHLQNKDGRPQHGLQHAFPAMPRNMAATQSQQDQGAGLPMPITAMQGYPQPYTYTAPPTPAYPGTNSHPWDISRPAQLILGSQAHYPSLPGDTSNTVADILNLTAHHLQATGNQKYLFPHSYIFRGEKKVKTTLGELSMPEYTWGLIQVINDPRTSVHDRPNLFYHLEKVCEHAMHFEWNEIRRWSEELFTLASLGRHNWADLHKEVDAIQRANPLDKEADNNNNRKQSPTQPAHNHNTDNGEPAATQTDGNTNNTRDLDITTGALGQTDTTQHNSEKANASGIDIRNETLHKKEKKSGQTKKEVNLIETPHTQLLENKSTEKGDITNLTSGTTSIRNVPTLIISNKETMENLTNEATAVDEAPNTSLSSLRNADDRHRINKPTPKQSGTHRTNEKTLRNQPETTTTDTPERSSITKQECNSGVSSIRKEVAEQGGSENGDVIHTNVSRTSDQPKDTKLKAKEIGPVTYKDTLQTIWPDPVDELWDKFTTQMDTYKKIKATGLPNYMKARIELTSALNYAKWDEALEDYEDKQICEFLRYGWPTSYTADTPPTSTMENHATANRFPTDVKRFIETELQHDNMLGLKTNVSNPGHK